MKHVRKLTAYFTHPLDGHSLVNADIQPLHEGEKSFNFPLEPGKHAEVRFSVQDEHEEKPYPELSPIREPSMDEVLKAVERMYGMIATGHERGLDCEIPDDEPEGFESARMAAGFALSNREWSVAEVFFRAGVEFANSSREMEEDA